jgi:hypothetical protein
MDVRYLLLLFLLVSCMPSGQVSKGNLESEGTSTNTTGGTSGGDSGTTTTTETQWNYLGTLSNSITINVSNLNNSYIAGTDIQTFLNTSGSFSEDYCLVSRYSISGFTHELRTRIIPISYYDFSAKKTVKILRVDFNDLANSKLACIVNTGSPLAIQKIDANGNILLLKGKSWESELDEAKHNWNFDYNISQSITDELGMVIQITNIMRK